MQYLFINQIQQPTQTTCNSYLLAASISKKVKKYFVIPARTPHIQRLVKHGTAFTKAIVRSKISQAEAIRKNLKQQECLICH